MSELLGVDLYTLVQGVGYIGLMAIVFAESGVFLGFFLPGDSLLFTVGIIASQGYLNVWLLIPLLIIAAVLGDAFGYWFGSLVGREMYTWEDTWYFKKSFLHRTEAFFAKYGKMAVIVSRFTPLIRTFVPILAGAGEMKYRTFFVYNVIGAVLWVCGLVLPGYFFGSIIPNPDRYILPVVVVIVLLSLTPAATAYMASLRKKPHDVE